MYNLSKLYSIKKIIDGALHRGCFFLNYGFYDLALIQSFLDYLRL